MSVIRRLYEVVCDRKENPREGSYVCALLAGGEDRILQKFGEEAVEAILAAKGGGAEALVAELADLVFHDSHQSSSATTDHSQRTASAAVVTSGIEISGWAWST
jgi:phosphoribosyl-ATP pyrophosphohydrolase